MLAALMLSASAAIVCQGRVCWHANQTNFPPEAKAVVHEDNRRWGRVNDSRSASTKVTANGAAAAESPGNRFYQLITREAARSGGLFVSAHQLGSLRHTSGTP
jgi:hypothetical protein